jgi:hypothetical protein
VRPGDVNKLSFVGPQRWIYAAMDDKHAIHPDTALQEQIRSAANPEELREAATEYLLRATENLAVPAAEFAGYIAALYALRPNDLCFAALVQDIGAGLIGLWQSVGRTSELLDAVLEASARADWTSVRELIAEQVEALCLATPTLEAVDGLRSTLLNCGPCDLSDYEEAVRAAFDHLLMVKPRRVASDLHQSRERLCPEQSAAELARAVHPLAANPLMAARIVQEAYGIIIEILHPLRLSSSRGSHLTTIFDRISAAVDSAGRSPEADATIGMIARAIPEQRLGEMIWHSLAESGTPPTLSLAKIRQIALNGDIDLAEFELREAVLPAVDQYYRLVQDAVEDFYDLAATFLSPLLNWGDAFSHHPGSAALPELRSVWRQYCACFPQDVAQFDAGLARIEEHGFNLVRISEVLRSYAPQFEHTGLREELEGRADAFIDEERPGLAVALALSDRTVIEAIRAANLEAMLSTPSLDALHSHLANPPLIRGPRVSLPQLNSENWFGLGPCPTLRLLRGNLKSAAAGASKPDWPLSAAGRRLIAVLGMYATGIITDSPQIISTEAGDSPASAAFSPAILALMQRHAASNGPMAKLFALHVNALSGGPGALKDAAPGSVIAQVAATLLDGLDPHDRVHKSMQSEPFNRQFLIEAGILPEIADLLARNDSDGISGAARIQAWCALTDTPMRHVLEWLNRQEPDWVRDFAGNALFSIDADRRGEFPLSSDNNIGYATFDGGRELEAEAAEEQSEGPLIARTIAGIGEWALATGHRMPGG